MRRSSAHLLIGLCVLVGGPAFSQTPHTSTPQAINLASQSLQSLAGWTTLTDITIQASANYVAGSEQETGTATHNCFIDSDWYFPSLSLAALATDSTQVIPLAGEQVYEGLQVSHLVLHYYLAGPSPGIIGLVEQVSDIELYVNASTLQPVALDFNIHPDYDANTSIPAEIRFCSYQQFNGVWAPLIES